jgi:hypothetical protein
MPDYCLLAVSRCSGFLKLNMMNIEKFQESKYYDDLLNAITENGGEDWSAVNKKFHCYVDESKEKHNELQYTHYFTITSELMEGEMHIEMENGINNGTVINDISFENNFKPTSRTVEVLKDIILDGSFYEKGSFLEIKAQAVLNANKKKLFEFHRQNNYDNYVTGGNSKMKIDDLLSQLELKYIYEEVEADVNFV